MTPTETIANEIASVTGIANATKIAAGMGNIYTIWDLPNYLAYLAAAKSGAVAAKPQAVAVPPAEELGNDMNKLSRLVLMMEAAMQAAQMPGAPAYSYTMKDLPVWVASIVTAITPAPVAPAAKKVAPSLVKKASQKPSRR